MWLKLGFRTRKIEITKEGMMSAAFAVTAKKSSHTTRRFSDEQIQHIASGNRVGIAKWVHSTAAEQHVSIRRTPSERFARAASRLSDAEFDLDQTEELLVALSRARVITPFQRGLLHVHYLR
jgi:hypothetical protein